LVTCKGHPAGRGKMVTRPAEAKVEFRFSKLRIARFSAASIGMVFIGRPLVFCAHMRSRTSSLTGKHTSG